MMGRLFFFGGGGLVVLSCLVSLVCRLVYILELDGFVSLLDREFSKAVSDN